MCLSLVDNRTRLWSHSEGCSYFQIMSRIMWACLKNASYTFPKLNDEASWSVPTSPPTLPTQQSWPLTLFTWGLPYHLHKSKQFLLLNQRSNPKAIVVLQVVVLVSVDCNPIHTAFPRFSPSLLKLVCVWFLLVWGLEVANLTEHSTWRVLYLHILNQFPRRFGACLPVFLTVFLLWG